jgi:hypothetical protein
MADLDDKKGGRPGTAPSLPGQRPAAPRPPAPGAAAPRPPAPGAAAPRPTAPVAAAPRPTAPVAAAPRPPAPGPSAPQTSGRPKFDERGVAVWEWQVQTGSFDLNADSQRVRALTDVELSIEEPSTPRKPGYKPQGFNPYAEPEPPARIGPAGRNPYSTGSKRPENVSYNPHRPAPVVKPRGEVAEQLSKRPAPPAEPVKKGLLSSLFGRDPKK